MGGRPAVRPQLDGALKLRTGHLRREGWIVPGGSTSGTLTWTNKLTGEQTDAIGFAATVGQEEGEARLHYWTRLHDGRRVVSDYKVPLVSTPQPFGGRRWWFLCPVTGSKAAVLYMPAGRTQFVSQRALRGSYRTQRVSPKDRALERAQGIRMALGGTANMMEPFPDKPPGMHWTTYQRERERAERAAATSLGFLAVRLDRIRPGWRNSIVGGA